MPGSKAQSSVAAPPRTRLSGRAVSGRAGCSATTCPHACLSVVVTHCARYRRRRVTTEASEELQTLLDGAQRAPAGRRHLWRRTAADPGRRRIRQDARPDAPDRLPGRDRRGAAKRDPRDHVHQQGGRRDAGAGRAAGRQTRPRDVGDDLPCGLRANAPRPRRPARLHPPVHDLRPGRLAPAGQALPRGERRRPQAVHSGGDPQPDLGRQEPPARRRGLRTAGRVVLRADGRRRLPQLRARAAPDERDGLRRSAGAGGQRARAVPGGPRGVPGGVPADPRRRVPGHQPRPVPVASAAGRRAPQPHRGRRPRPVDLRLPRRRHPQHPRRSRTSSPTRRSSSSSRTTAPRRRSSTPPTR